MSTEYYLKFLPEEKLSTELSKRLRKSLIKNHDLNLLWELLRNEAFLDNDSIKVLNTGIRGPYSNGYYCSFKIEDELAFWTKLINRFPENGFLNVIYAEYLVQQESGYFTAHEYYKKAFEQDYRLIFWIEPSWRDELLEQDFEYELYYLRVQKDDYEPEDFDQAVDILLIKYRDEPEKIDKIKKTAC